MNSNYQETLEHKNQIYTSKSEEVVEETQENHNEIIEVTETQTMQQRRPAVKKKLV